MKIKLGVLLVIILISCCGCVSQEQRVRRERLMQWEIELAQQEKSLKSREVALDNRWVSVCGKRSSMRDGFDTVIIIKETKELFDEF